MAESLRERSRARRRAAIVNAALKLFAERGYDATTVAQVAEAAEVSPRTVSLYFPSKLELALAYIADSAQRLSEACTHRGAGETTLDILSDWLNAEQQTYGQTIALLRAMLAANPALRGAETPDIAASKRQVNQALADDLGRYPDDAVMRIVNGAMAGAVSGLLLIDPEDDDATAAFDVANRLFKSVVDSAKSRNLKTAKVGSAG